MAHEKRPTLKDVAKIRLIKLNICAGYINSSSPQFKTILDILEELKCDEDSDIRYFASECEQPKEDKI